MKLVELWMDKEKCDYLSHLVINGRRSANSRLCAHMLNRPMGEWIPAVTTRHTVWSGLIGELSSFLNSLHFTVRFVGDFDMYEVFREMVSTQIQDEIVVKLEYCDQNSGKAGIVSLEEVPGDEHFGSVQQPPENCSAQGQVHERISSSVCLRKRDEETWKSDVFSELTRDIRDLLENACDRYLQKRLRVIARFLGKEDINIYLNILYDEHDTANIILHMDVPRLYLHSTDHYEMSMPAVLGSSRDVVEAFERICQLHMLPFENVMVLVVSRNEQRFDSIARKLRDYSSGVRAFCLSGDAIRDDDTLFDMTLAYFSYLEWRLAQLIRSYPRDAWVDATIAENVLSHLCSREKNGRE